jgi:hypothetical protein
MAWQMNGRYAETCNCDYLCPCATTALAKTTYGYCVFAMALEVEKGHYDGTSLAGRRLLLVCRTPGNMLDGNWQVGLIVDDGADDKQKEALTAIVSGQAGGPMAGLAPLIGKFLGVETAPVKLQGGGKDWSFSAGKFADHELEGTTGIGGDQLYLDGVGHPVSPRLALARAKKSHVHVFGIDWDQMDGRNNGHFASFDWKG